MFLDKIFIGQKFKEYRKSKKLTQFQLAEQVGLNEKQISRIEAGLNYPTYITFVKLIEALEINITDFFKNNKTELCKSKQDLESIINHSKEFELKLYLDVIKTIKKNLNLNKIP